MNLPAEQNPSVNPEKIRQIKKSDFKGSTEDLQELFLLMAGFKELERLLGIMTEAANKINWVLVSPDGQLGGKGFILTIEELQETLEKIRRSSGKCKASLFDECYNNPFWKEVKDKYLESKRENSSVPEPVDDVETGVDNSPGNDELEYDFGT